MSSNYTPCRCGMFDAPTSEHDIECPRHVRAFSVERSETHGPTGAPTPEAALPPIEQVRPAKAVEPLRLHLDTTADREEARATAELRPEAKLPYTQAGRSWTPTEMAGRALDDATHTSHAIDLGRQHIAHLRSIPPCGGDHAEDAADRLWADASAGERERRFKARLEGDLQLKGAEQAPEPQPVRSLQWQVTALTEAVRALQQDFQKLLEIQSTLIEMVGKEK